MTTKIVTVCDLCGMEELAVEGKKLSNHRKILESSHLGDEISIRFNEEKTGRRVKVTFNLSIQDKESRLNPSDGVVYARKLDLCVNCVNNILEQFYNVVKQSRS